MGKEEFDREMNKIWEAKERVCRLVSCYSIV